MYENLPKAMRPPSEPVYEPRATCDACPMARADWPRDARDEGPFRADLKCCTYIPFLPNFTLGRLSDEAYAKAVATVAEKRARFTPLGLIPEVGAEVFGQDENARCPFLGSDARCTIWSERPTVCRTYFCVSAQQAEWALKEERGNDLEWLIAHELLWSLGFTDEETEHFAEWVGRERDFFVECASRAGEF